MPRRSESPSAFSDEYSDVDGNEHDVPLLPNQKPSDVHPQSGQNSFAKYKRLIAEYYSEATRLYQIHRNFLFLFVFVAAFAIVFVKLFFSHKTTSSPSNSNISELTPSYFTDLGSRRVRIKYGPFSIPMSTIDNGMAHFLEKNSLKPCEDCLITFIQAGLEYPDGTTANADSGLWLHHVVQMDTAVDDTVCGKAVTQQQLAPNRFFASGNERSAVHLSAQGTQHTGYFLSKNSHIMTLTELMNETPKNVSAVLTIDYEFVPANPFPSSFNNLTSAWLDVGGCHDSDVPAERNETFILDTPTPWIVPDDLLAHGAGKIIFTEGHLHDGGTHIEILRNGHDTICSSNATYGVTPGFVDHKMIHISNMTACGIDEPSIEDNIVRAGDKFDLRAHYDMIVHNGMLEADGTLAPVMGIAIMYMASSGSLN